MMTAAAGPRIEDLDIRAVCRALQVPTRSNRFQVTWRNGDSWSGSLNPTIGAWTDHKTGTGGGILALVETALGCDRRAALAWLGVNFGVTTGNTYSPAARRAYARNIDRARTAAATLVERRDLYLTDLRTASGLLLAQYHKLTTEAEATQDIEFAAQAETVFAKLDELATRRDWLRAASVPELASWFATLDEWKAA